MQMIAANALVISLKKDKISSQIAGKFIFKKFNLSCL
jgi:hypothetical protein